MTNIFCWTTSARSPAPRADAGIEGLVWHDLRATFGTRLGEAGCNAYTIMALMGHADIKSSLRYVRSTDPTPAGGGRSGDALVPGTGSGACP